MKQNPNNYNNNLLAYYIFLFFFVQIEDRETLMLLEVTLEMSVNVRLSSLSCLSL